MPLAQGLHDCKGCAVGGTVPQEMDRGDGAIGDGGGSFWSLSALRGISGFLKGSFQG